MTPDLLDPEVRTELAGLPRNLADKVAGHLAAAEMLMPEDPAEGYRHARHARNLASRVGAVREACGIAAYHVGEWAEALAELRTARRVTGNDAYLPMMADCERGLGRPERALDMARSAEVERLDQAGQIEMRIVASGARRDLGQSDAAVVGLQGPELESRQRRPWSARLYYAYAEALLGAGRGDEAVTWFARAEAADEAGETDADERLAEIQGVDLADLDEDIVWGDGEESDPDATHLWTDPDTIDPDTIDPDAIDADAIDADATDLDVAPEETAQDIASDESDLAAISDDEHLDAATDAADRDAIAGEEDLEAVSDEADRDADSDEPDVDTVSDEAYPDVTSDRTGLDVTRGEQVIQPESDARAEPGSEQEPESEQAPEAEQDPEIEQDPGAEQDSAVEQDSGAEEEPETEPGQDGQDPEAPRSES